jgi:hypothetical protein
MLDRDWSGDRFCLALRGDFALASVNRFIFEALCGRSWRSGVSVLIRRDLLPRRFGACGMLLSGVSKSSMPGSDSGVLRFWRGVVRFLRFAFETLTSPRTVGASGCFFRRVVGEALRTAFGAASRLPWSSFLTKFEYPVSIAKRSCSIQCNKVLCRFSTHSAYSNSCSQASATSVAPVSSAFLRALSNSFPSLSRCFSNPSRRCRCQSWNSIQVSS